MFLLSLWRNVRVYCFQIWKPSPGWCSDLGSASHHIKNVFLLCKFVTKLESVLLSELEALARMCEYDMFSAAVWTSWCLFHTWEQSRQKVFLLSLWQNVKVYCFQIWKPSPGWCSEPARPNNGFNRTTDYEPNSSTHGRPLKRTESSETRVTSEKSLASRPSWRKFYKGF